MSAVKEGWTYKKLGEVGTLLRGKGIQKTDFVENGRPCIHYGQIHTIFGVSTERHITSIPDELFEKSVIASKGDVLLTLTSEDVEGSCKSTAWLGDYDIAVSSDAAIYKHSLNPKFVVYYLQSNSFFSEKAKYARGFKVTHIKTADIAEISIPIPPLPTQQSIVSELDKINELIALKKSQLKDLDSLAQSIFYDMFGAPITNEKGWDLSRLMDNVVEMFLGPFGSSLKVDSYVPFEESYCMVYEQKHAIQKSIYLDNHYINEEKYNSLSRFKVEAGDFIMSCRGTIGKLYRLPSNAPMGIIHPSLMKIRIKESSYNPTYFAYMLPIIVSNQNTYGNCVQMAITAKALGNMQLGLPPLSLQHQFAERVESIERMKQQVQTAIKELETLLASRMQYWFD